MNAFKNTKDTFQWQKVFNDHEKSTVHFNKVERMKDIMKTSIFKYMPNKNSLLNSEAII